MTFGIAYNVLIVLITFCAVVLISFETGGLLIDGLFVWCLLFVVAFTSLGFVLYWPDCVWFVICLDLVCWLRVAVVWV